MSNFLGTGDPKLAFTWDSSPITVEYDSKYIQFIPKFNQQEQRIHKSVLNGNTTKEHLGFYHEAELYFIDITAGDYENKLRYLQVVDTVTLTPFKDNTYFTIEMLIEKAYPYEFEHLGESITAFYMKMSGTSYDELTPKPTFEGSTIWIVTEDF